MKVLQVGASHLTNVEVCELVNQELGQYDAQAGSLSKSEQVSAKGLTLHRLRTSARNVILYLERCYPAVRRCTESHLQSFLDEMAEFPLTELEVLQLLNHAAVEPVYVYGLVEECNTKFSEEQVGRICDIVQKHLLSAPRREPWVEPTLQNDLPAELEVAEAASRPGPGSQQAAPGPAAVSAAPPVTGARPASSVPADKGSTRQASEAKPGARASQSAGASTQQAAGSSKPKGTTSRGAPAEKSSRSSQKPQSGSAASKHSTASSAGQKHSRPDSRTSSRGPAAGSTPKRSKPA